MGGLGAAVAQIVVGLIETLFGRRLFWLFVGIAGFLAGWFVAPALWETFRDSGTMDTWLRLLIGIGTGIALGLLALMFVRTMVAIAGFLVFAVLTIFAFRYFGGEDALPTGSRDFWIAFGVGGAVGSVLMGTLFNWALIVITALIGAAATVDGILYFFTPENPTAADPGPAKWIEWVAVAVLFAVGLAVQISTRKRGLLRRR